MAKLIDDVSVKAGRVIKVWNTERKAFSNSKDYYNAIWVEDANGGNERCLLFTDHELERAEYRASKNTEDLPQKGFWTDLFD